jgi:hypothetical protein
VQVAWPLGRGSLGLSSLLLFEFSLLGRGSLGFSLPLQIQLLAPGLHGSLVLQLRQTLSKVCLLRLQVPKLPPRQLCGLAQDCMRRRLCCLVPLICFLEHLLHLLD